jgi:hypothetical protein
MCNVIARRNDEAIHIEFQPTLLTEIFTTTSSISTSRILSFVKLLTTTTFVARVCEPIYEA